MKQTISKDDVLSYLEENPDFFNLNPELILKYFQPDRSETNKVSDFQQFMIKKLQNKLEHNEKTEKLLIDYSRQNMTNQNRVHMSVLALLHARTLSDLIETITIDLAVLLDIDFAGLCIEDDGSFPDLMFKDFVSIDEFVVDKEIGRENFIILRDNLSSKKSYYKHAKDLIKSDALSRLQINECQAMLVLGSRVEGFFHPDQGTEHLNFLTRVIEVCLNKMIELYS